MYVRSESARADKRLVGAFVPTAVARDFERKARDLNAPFADALSAAMEMWVAMQDALREAA